MSRHGLGGLALWLHSLQCCVLTHSTQQWELRARVRCAALAGGQWMGALIGELQTRVAFQPLAQLATLGPYSGGAFGSCL